MRKEDFVALTEKYHNNECTYEEKQLVEYFFDSMQDSDEVKLTTVSDEKGRQLLLSIKKATGQKAGKQKRRFARSLQIAASLFIVAGLAFTFKLSTSTPVKEITQITLKGERKEIKLKDGSLIVLNANSSITYPDTFTGTREIQLKGEAYFKVHRDTTKPFIVTMHDASVKVLGTSFNINSYNRSGTKVTVLTGKVEVSSPSGKKVVLTKNQQAGIAKNQELNVTNDDSNDGIAWTDNIIFLKKTTLGETASIIEDWYNVTIKFEDPSLRELTISGKFKNEKLENVLNSIALLKNLKINYITKNHVLIRRNTNAI